ncbi:MAG: DUF4160 domain-containing protein [Haliscomenobacter sp.]|uniref:DUF4160 domain-containing protein n=1 Tax=Haliscomenobacter sp. TaxID=2717303 RepID=UPI0029BF7BF5|nr:DUF4160 domain-containing protein [Haliscomenobacter sp.]MDX2070547.1 DUF4160 domain-containing protein [Haliscomenobacter sp.]
MPELSRFYGIIIYMYAKDHFPPHFHAKYGDYTATFYINNCELQEGNLPKRALQLVKEWASLHKEELSANWETAQSDNPKFFKINPLD